MSTVLILGAIIFAVSSFYFIIKPKKEFNSAFLVSFITLISYLIMLQGNFATNDLYWTRWVFYALSCPLLAFEISKRVKLDIPNRIFNIFLTVITMITGALASVSVGNYKIIFFLISCIAFVVLLNEFYKTKSKELAGLNLFIIFGWCIFPLVFMFSNEGMINVVPLQIAGIIYLALDIFTKIIFYIKYKEVSSE